MNYNSLKKSPKIKLLKFAIKIIDFSKTNPQSQHNNSQILILIFIIFRLFY